MPKPSTGELRKLVNGFEARVRIDDEGNRKGYRLAAILPTDETGARERCEAMAKIAQRLRRTGDVSQIDQMLTMAAKARAGKPWEAVLRAVDHLCSGTTEAMDRPVVPTFGKLLDDWTNGELAKRHPHHVKKKRSADTDSKRAKKHVPEDLLNLAVDEWTLAHADTAMANIPEALSDGSRRHVAQIIRKVLKFAVYPCRYRQDNPIPEDWVPKVSSKKAKECLYPDEDAKLLAHREIPLARRLAYGFLAREGMRVDELSRLTWRDVDLERGRVDLDENKTDDPRSWALDDGVLAALRIWREDFYPNADEKDRVFVDNGIPLKVDRLAEQLRADLRAAGVKREKLFESSKTRLAIRAHDLRATFVTISLAMGKTESWVSERTGHASSAMIQRYRRKASTWSQMNLSGLSPLWKALPELSAPRNAPYFVGQPGLEPETNGLRGPEDTPENAEAREKPRAAKSTSAETERDGANVGRSPGHSLPADDLLALVSELRGMIADLSVENARLREAAGEPKRKPALKSVRGGRR